MENILHGPNPLTKLSVIQKYRCKKNGIRSHMDWSIISFSSWTIIMRLVLLFVVSKHINSQTTLNIVFSDVLLWTILVRFVYLKNLNTLLSYCTFACFSSTGRSFTKFHCNKPINFFRLLECLHFNFESIEYEQLLYLS